MRAGARATRVVGTLERRLRHGCRLAFFLLCFSAAAASGPGLIQLNETGRIPIAGRSTPYVVRHLPAASFPQMPLTVQDGLSERGCLIPQTYEARQPENAVHGSFERPGSSDWAVLCSTIESATASWLTMGGRG